MFFILSKVLSFIVAPLYWIIAMLWVAIFTKKIKLRRGLLLAVAILLPLFSNQWLANTAMLWWEHPPVPFNNIQEQHYDMAIVLTGVTQDKKSPKDRIYFNRGADRVLFALRLYKEGKVKRILISGAEFSTMGQLVETGRSLKDVLVLAGVPEGDVWIEGESRNTRENALYTARILKERLPKESNYLLITSAFHTARAKGCFEREGVKADMFPADFYAEDFSLRPDMMLGFSPDALSRWHIIFHEIAGIISYKVAGYI
jgi:uncharacterized SAM-binding protein YcdF (DUF218 family)